MDSPFAYVLLCQNQSVFLSRSVSIWGDAKEVPFIPQDSLKVRKYAGMTHPHSHSSFPLISLLENRDTAKPRTTDKQGDTDRAFLCMKKESNRDDILS